MPLVMTGETTSWTGCHNIYLPMKPSNRKFGVGFAEGV